MFRELKNRRVLITGGSRGIGFHLAEKMVNEGARVVATARSEEPLRELANRLTAQGADILGVPADLTLDQDRQRVMETAIQHMGGLDLLVNNAGVASFGHFIDSSEELLRKVVEVNFFTPAEMIRLAIPHLQQGIQPAIVNVSSLCGRRGLPAWPEHSASKHALCGLTEALRGEMARFDIDVLLILPGVTRSDLGKHLLRNQGRMKIPFDRGMDPALVAEGILQAIKKNRTETVLGGDARWILWVNRFLPGLVSHLLARRVLALYGTEGPEVPVSRETAEKIVS